MSLISCPVCGREVSRAASQCPGCGHPLKPDHTTRDSIIGKVAAVVGIWVLAPWVTRVVAVIAAGIATVVMFAYIFSGKS
jgi:uncharacterized membrane protein YvbJ